MDASLHAALCVVAPLRRALEHAPPILLRARVGAEEHARELQGYGRDYGTREDELTLRIRQMGFTEVGVYGRKYGIYGSQSSARIR